MSSNFEDVQELHRVYETTPVADDLGTGSPYEMGSNLIIEEVKKELLPALIKYSAAPSLENLVEVADGLVDSVVVIMGLANQLGLPWQEMWNEVHRSNMSKLGEDGRPIKRADGKFLKGPNYSPPDLHSILMRRLEQNMLTRNPELREFYAAAIARQEQTL
jgi:hypothetical protein